MIAYIARRIVTLIPILFLISVVSFVVIELPPGDWVSFQIESLRMSGIELGQDEADRHAAVRPGQAAARALPALDGEHDHPRQLRLVLPVESPRERSALGASPAHDGHLGRLAAAIVGYCNSHWHLFSDPPIFGLGLHIYVYRLHWSGDAGFPGGPGARAGHIYHHRLLSARPVLQSISRRAVVDGEIP